MTTLDHARTILASFCVCSPALFIGLLMMIDPASFVISLRALAGVLRTVEERFRGSSQWQAHMQEPAAEPVSPAARLALRFAGLALALCAVAYFADAVK
jgi:hypothetical protein